MDVIAYIDPGTGSMFIQAIIGSALAISVAFRAYFKKAYNKVKQTISTK